MTTTDQQIVRRAYTDDSSIGRALRQSVTFEMATRRLAVIGLFWSEDALEFVKVVSSDKQIVQGAIAMLGSAFHPDTPAAEYINLESNLPTFTAAEADGLDRAIDGLISEGVDVYELALRELTS